MHLYTIQTPSGPKPALEKQGALYLLEDAGIRVPDLLSLIHSDHAVEMLQKLKAFSDRSDSPAPACSLENARILSPIPYPDQDIICVGLNYREHMDETRHVEDFTGKEATVYFSKHVSRASGPDDVIPAYPFVDSLDYEVELGVILGKNLFGYNSAKDPDPVFGYTVFNDVSARNLQFRHKQWFLGKSLDGYTIMGPCIVTADELPDPGRLQISCQVNGEIRQNSNTCCMITPVPELLEDLSRGMTLRAGTILATGTPGGVAIGMQEPSYLKPGDTVTCEIQGIGVLENVVAAV